LINTLFLFLGSSKRKSNETRSSSIMMDTSIASDPEENARRARRAQRFGEFLEPQQLVRADFLLQSP